uniref:Uncharacterized protein n=1 Tax=Globisporangium ultimum (strain ATCC 200006 / CBS 805.95 / DAOM BR144) TaxID=431595 RepID=K3WXQ8_GLOUD
MSTYVVAGMLYFVAHPKLWLTSLCPILMTIVVAAVSVVLLFSLGLYPQAELLEDAGVPSGLSWLLAVIMVIIEIFLVTLIYSLVVIGCFMDKIFEQVLVNRGFGHLVENESKHSSCMRACGACCRVSLWLRVVVLVTTLPLNLIPLIGTLTWIWLNGTILAWEYHLYYFELKGYTYAEQKQFIDAHKAQYSSFGMQAMFVEMIPFAGSLFLFTNAVGAALFAADLEEEMAQSQAYRSATDPNLDPNAPPNPNAPPKNSSNYGSTQHPHHTV